MHPSLVKHLIFPIHERLMGRKTFSFLQELEELQWLPRDRLEELRFAKLQALLMHAKENIPFYARRFAEAGFDPKRMQDITDMRAIPPLTKAEIRRNLDDMQWRRSPGGLQRYNTGGSSGQPLVFYFDRRRQAYDAAARALTHRWWGVDIGERELYLWGSPVELTKQDRIKQIRDSLVNALLVSAFELSAEAVPELVRTLRRFHPACVFGYPSTIALFCSMAEEQGLSLNTAGVRVVFSTAEVLYPHQRERISEAFGNVPVTDCYGSREGGFVSHECPKGRYHVLDPNYVLEYLVDGRPAGRDEDGEIVLTHLDAWGMPFIRYLTGDVARPGVEGCACGRTWSTMTDLRGRTTDFVVTPDGRWQHALSLIYIVRDIEGVDEFKIIQETVDYVRVLLNPHPDLFPEDGPERIAKGIKMRMGAQVTVHVEEVASIPREASGKYRYVVSKVAGKQMGG